TGLCDCDMIPEILKELKNLTATDMSNPGQAFHSVFEFLNVYRFQAGLETIGEGRYIGLFESTIVITAITQSKIVIPGLKTPGANVYFEPFRWDQKMFTFVLSSPTQTIDWEIAAMSNAMHSDNEVYAIWTKDAMKKCIENGMAVQKPPHPEVRPQYASFMTPSVWVMMEESNGDKPALKKFKMNIFPQHEQGITFPLPESYWVDDRLNIPPVRSAIPVITYSKTPVASNIPNGFPYDRFTIDQAPWEELIAASELKPLFVKNSFKKEGQGEPIGFIKKSANATRGNSVMMYILPYNFPRLFKLIEILNKTPSMKAAPPSYWMAEFRQYLAEIPPYYHAKLKTMMAKLRLDHLMSPSLMPPIKDWPISNYKATVVNQ
ncbi:Integrator complex subunit 6, partial [Physocladia obscura]